MSYAEDAAEAEADLLDASEGATCTVRRLTGSARSGGAIVPSYSDVTGIPVVDIGSKRLPVEGGGLVRRRTLLLGAVKLNAAGVDPKQADLIVIGAESFQPGQNLEITTIRPNPTGPAVLHQLEVIG